jgi:hypothetical protein
MNRAIIPDCGEAGFEETNARVVCRFARTLNHKGHEGTRRKRGKQAFVISSCPF